MSIVPFSVPYDAASITDLRHRLAATRWPSDIQPAGWKFGTDSAWLQDICAYWQNGHDWQASVERLNRQPHFLFFSNPFQVHFLHLQSGDDTRPLLLLHGWPGSFLEFERIAPLLTGAGFSLVIPSLPGYGFSPHPRTPGVNQQVMADAFAALMQELGYDTFFVQGGDIGAGVATALAMRHASRVRAFHLNFLPRGVSPAADPANPFTPEEEHFQSDSERWLDANGAYSHMHRTRPQTAAYALNDSPAGLAGWMLEKFHEWSDNGGDIYSVFSRDFLLDNLTLYWTTQTIRSSMQVYAERAQVPVTIRPSNRISVPLSFARFPCEISSPPRRWVERMYTVARWTDMPRGGHFAAAEQPQLLADDLLSSFSD